MVATEMDVLVEAEAHWGLEANAGGRHNRWAQMVATEMEVLVEAELALVVEVRRSWK